jgi:hypothetical protein
MILPNKLNDEEMRVNKWVNTGHQMSLIPTSTTDKSSQTRYVVPFSPLFQIERIVDFKLAVHALPSQTKTNKTDGGKTGETERMSTPAVDFEEETEQTALMSLFREGVMLRHRKKHPLDPIVAFKNYDFSVSRSTRYIPMDLRVASSEKLDSPMGPNFYNSFPFPAFHLTSSRIPSAA